MPVKIGIRKPSLTKRIAARTSIKRMVRAKVRAPRGLGWVTNPKKAAYNRVYRRTTIGCLVIPLAILLLLLALAIAACGASITPTRSVANSPSHTPTRTVRTSPTM
jgi:hypothetical protein